MNQIVDILCPHLLAAACCSQNAVGGWVWERVPERGTERDVVLMAPGWGCAASRAQSCAELVWQVTEGN